MFPIPEGAVIDSFSMFINGKETKGEVLDAKKAQSIYEDIVRKMIDPALLEYYGQGLFKARIFPIEPHGKKRVKISYRQLLNRDNGTIAYRYPLNTEKFSSKTIPETAISVKISANKPIKNIYCTSHEVDIVRKTPKSAIVSFETRDVKPDRDFLLYYTTNDSKFGFSFLTQREKGGDGYFFLDISPDISHKEIDSKDITFVLDVSGSMAGKKLEQAQKALQFCIANLNKDDRFEIIRFSTEARTLFGKLMPYEKKNIDEAHQFIEGLQSIGGTNIEEALTLALKNADSASSRRHIILFMTDGKPTIGSTEQDALLEIVKKANTNDIRIFTLGIGDNLNIHLLDKLTEMTKAWRTYVGSEEDLELKISDLYTKLQSPILTNVELKTQGVKFYQTYPRDLPDLFIGSSLTILGRYSGNGDGKIVLSGTIEGKRQQFEYTHDTESKNHRNYFISPLWAARRIGFLLDAIRLHGEEKELVDEVVLLAKNFGIVTPYTSYLILEDEDHLVGTRRIQQEERIFDRMAPHAKLRKRSEGYFNDMKEESGKAGVNASKELQQLNNVTTIAQAKRDDERLAFEDNAGNTHTINEKIRLVESRAMYKTDNQWIDPLLQSVKPSKTTRIQFGTAKYFGFLKKHPEVKGFFALGKNVKFLMGSVLVDVYE